MSKEIIKKIDDLRTEIRKEYEIIGNAFYEITKLLDEHLEYLKEGLEEKDGNI